jgi:hypothetical protein
LEGPAKIGRDKNQGSKVVEPEQNHLCRKIKKI